MVVEGIAKLATYMDNLVPLSISNGSPLLHVPLSLMLMEHIAK
jgi:hypothetical protein